MRGTARLALCLGLLGGGAGCKLYHALPLDRQAKETALQRPDLERLQVEAGRLRHPLLKPLAIDPGGALSPDQAALVAVLANPDLRAVRDQRALAQAQLLDAGLLPDPVLSYSQDNPVGGLDQGAVPARSLQLSLDLTSLLTRAPRRQAAQAQQASVDLDVAWQEWQVAEAAKLSALRLGTLEPQAALGRETLAALAENLEAVDRGAAVGAATLGDLAAARAALDAGKREALALDLDRDREKLALNALLGLPPAERLKLAAPAGPAWEGLPSGDELLGGLDRRLDLVALEQGYASEDARVRLAVWSQFPSIGISLSRSRDTTPVETRGAGVALSLPLFNRGQGAVAIETATRQQLRDQYLARLVRARSDLAQAQADLAAVKAMLATAGEALPALEAQARASEKAYREGGLDLLARNQARLACVDQKATLLSLRRNLDELGVALELAAGRTLSIPATERSR